MPVDPAAAATQMMFRMMAGSQAAARQQGPQSDQQAAKIQSENRSAYRQQLQKAFDAGDQDRINALAPEAMKAGVDVSPYRVQPSPEAQISNQFMQTLAEKLGLGKQKAPSLPNLNPDTAFDVPANAQQPQQSPATKAMQALEQIFTPEFAARVVAKKAGGIDVGEHALTDQQWFNDYLRLPSTMDASAKKELLASKYGYIPVQASQLKDLPIEERKNITQSAITKFLQDPAIDAAFKKAFPNGDQKAKLGMILAKMSGDEGMPIPDEYKPFLDRFLNLHDSMVQMKADEAARREAATTKARLGAEFEMEPQKPVSAEDRAKYGVGSKIPTYESLANSGFRFPTETDRKLYQQFSSTRQQFIALQDLMFGKDGIFTGIGNDIISRKTAQAELLKDRAVGNQRGRNYEVFSDKLQTFARSLLVLAGESGGRFTDKDVDQMVKGWASLGGVFGPIDSEAIAKQKFDMSIVDLNRKMGQLTQGVVVNPMGGEKGAAPKPAPETPKYETGKTYRDAQGNRAKYLGDGKWQKIQTK